MFAVYASKPNPDEPLKSLTVGERPEPEAADGWVAVDVAAASLNMHDLWTLRGVGIKPDQFPMILGCDGAGRLADCTEVVLHPVIGDPGVAGTRPSTRSARCHREVPGDVRRHGGGAGTQRRPQARRAVDAQAAVMVRRG
jgi:NADPH:quinone reductase-like Zn-dependent oxidoreductase